MLASGVAVQLSKNLLGQDLAQFDAHLVEAVDGARRQLVLLAKTLHILQLTC